MAPKTKPAHNTEYYYDCQPEVWDNMLYPEAILDRRDRSRDLYFALLKEEMEYKKVLPFDKRTRLWKVEKAYRDNQKLLDERTTVI